MTSMLTRSAAFSALAFISAHAFAGPHQVPFKASVAIVDTIGQPGSSCPTGQLFGSSVGTGHASHLGRITFVATDCVNVIGLGQGGLPIFRFQGGPDSLTITAANGDTISGTYSGTLVPAGAPDKNGFAPYTVQDGMFSIVRGTGRFANVVNTSGALTGNENLNLNLASPVPSTGNFQLDGQISY